MQVVAVDAAIEEELQHFDLLAAVGRLRRAEQLVFLARFERKRLGGEQHGQYRDKVLDEFHEILLGLATGQLRIGVVSTPFCFNVARALFMASELA